MSGTVLDASAILAVINNEPGALVVVEALKDRALLSAVNYAEVLTKLIERGWTGVQQARSCAAWVWR